MRTSIKNALLLLGICSTLLFSGCSAILQPEKADLVKATKDRLAHSYCLDISIKAENSGNSLSYAGTGFFNPNATSYLCGTTEILIEHTLTMEQSCVSKSENDSVYQAYKEKWVNVNRALPDQVINDWMLMIENGRGSLLHKKISGSEISKELSDITLFCIRIPSIQINLSDWCNAFYDEWFYGFADMSPEADLRLFFNNESYELVAIQADSTSTGSPLSITALLCDCSEPPIDSTQQWSVADISDSVLGEQWNIKENGENKNDPQAPSESQPQVPLDEKFINVSEPRVIIEGKNITFPCPLSELQNMGFEPMHPLDGITSPTIVNLSLNDIGHIIAIVDVDTNGELSVNGIYVSIEDIGNISVVFPWGVSLKSTISDVEQHWIKIDNKGTMWRVGESCISDILTSDNQIYMIGLFCS